MPQSLLHRAPTESAEQWRRLRALLLIAALLLGAAVVGVLLQGYGTVTLIRGSQASGPA